MLEPGVTALLFPGQGSQEVGMGAALAAKYHVARQTFEEANDVLGYDLSRLCFEGPEDELTDTSNAQPALYTAGIAAMRALYEFWGGDSFVPAYVAGHSLGEFTALTAAGAISFPDGLRLVRRRGELMRDADQHSPGGMTALLGLDRDVVEALCTAASAATGGVVVVANDNCPGQLVIAGDEETLADAMERASEAGARKVVRLAVSIAAHSPLMARAAADFKEALENTAIHDPMVPIIGNTSALPLNSAQEVREELHAQLTSAVRWSESIEAMAAANITTYVELGSKDVLVGLVKRIDRGSTRLVVDSPEGLEALG